MSDEKFMSEKEYKKAIKRVNDNLSKFKIETENQVISNNEKISELEKKLIVVEINDNAWAKTIEEEIFELKDWRETNAKDLEKWGQGVYKEIAEIKKEFDRFLDTNIIIGKTQQKILNLLPSIKEHIDANKEVLRDYFAGLDDYFEDHNTKKFRKRFRKLHKTLDGKTEKKEVCEECLYKENFDDNTCGACNPNTSQSRWKPKDSGDECKKKINCEKCSDFRDGRGIYGEHTYCNNMYDWVKHNRKIDLEGENPDDDEMFDDPLFDDEGCPWDETKTPELECRNCRYDHDDYDYMCKDCDENNSKFEAKIK